MSVTVSVYVRDGAGTRRCLRQFLGYLRSLRSVSVPVSISVGDGDGLLLLISVSVYCFQWCQCCCRCRFVAGVVHVGLSLSLSRVSVSLGVVIGLFSVGLFRGSDDCVVGVRCRSKFV